MDSSITVGLAGAHTAAGAADEPRPLDDEALATRGDADSFVLLYRRYLRPVYAYLYARLGDRQEAEDLAGMAFERALTGLHAYRPTGSFRGWLFTIVRRTLADRLRQGGPSRPVSLESVEGELYDPAAGPEEQALASDRLREVLRVVGGLGHEQQEVIALRFVAGLPYAEIARIVGKREPAVKMLAYRALEEIRRRCRDEEE